MALDPRNEPAPAPPVEDAEGFEIALSDRWHAGPTVVVFLRHFG